MVDPSMRIEDERDARRAGCGPRSDQPDVGTGECDFLAEFAARNENITRAGDINRWARRFERGEQFRFADLENQELLLNILEERDLSEEAVDNFCEAR